VVFVCGKLGFHSVINMGHADRFVSHGSVSRIGSVCIGGNQMTNDQLDKVVFWVCVVVAVVVFYFNLGE